MEIFGREYFDELLKIFPHQFIYHDMTYCIMGMFGKIHQYNVLAINIWQIGVQSNCCVIVATVRHTCDVWFGEIVHPPNFLPLNIPAIH